jgi:hypothetical protein
VFDGVWRHLCSSVLGDEKSCWHLMSGARRLLNVLDSRAAPTTEM